MKILSSLFIILLLGACGVSKSAITSATIESNAPVNLIVHGDAKIQSISTLKTDTALLIITYDFYENQNQGLLPFQDSINFRIVDFVLSNTEFEIDYDPNKKLSTDFFLTQLTYFDSLSRLESDMLEEGQLWELESTIDIIEFKNFVELDLSIWNYTGGAHGNGFTSYSLIDRVNGTELTLSDFISDVPTFTELAEKYFRAQNEINENANLTDEGFWFTDGIFVCNENFYFEDGNMNFLFNNYEIAPYSAGQISVSIPLNELKPFLKIQP